jgi:hypothetical protein
VVPTNFTLAISKAIFLSFEDLVYPPRLAFVSGGYLGLLRSPSALRVCDGATRPSSGTHQSHLNQQYRLHNWNIEEEMVRLSANAHTGFVKLAWLLYL